MMHFQRAFMRWRGPFSIFILIFFAALLGSLSSARAVPANTLPVAQLIFSQARPEPATQPSPQPLLAAGDADALWLVRPLTVDSKMPGFEILLHPVNRRKGDRDYWQPITRDQQRYFSGVPSTVAAINSSQGSQVCVIMHDGQAVVYGALGQQPLPRLPMGRPVAAIGVDDELVALTRGPALFPEAAAAPTQPATATRPGKEDWSLWIYRSGRWQPLPSPGLVAASTGTESFTPSATARVQLARQGDELALMWIEPGHAHQLYVRTLKFRDTKAVWSAPIDSELPEDAQYFHALGIGPRIYVVWVRSDGLKQVLSGGMLDSDYRFSARQRIDRAPLGLPSAAPIPAYDIIVARTGDALSVLYEVATGKEAALGSVTLSTSGRVLYPAQEIVPDIGTTDDSNVLQHSAMILLILLLAISLWQWRKRPMHPQLPQGYAVARLYQRVAAALIDLAVAFGAVVLLFGLYQDDLGALTISWIKGIIQLDNSANSWPFVSMFGIYIAHVTVSELLTCRSLGKLLLGLRVVAIDGTEPTKLSLLLRNLMRVPELATRILLIYMVINEQRQRLGDLIARTTVISERPVGDDSSDEMDDRQ